MMLVLVKHRRMRTATNFFLANLSIADLCVSIFCIFQTLSRYLMDDWALGDFMCKMYHFINGLSYTTSVNLLMIICVERYLAIAHPLLSKQVRKTLFLYTVIHILLKGYLVTSTARDTRLMTPLFILFYPEPFEIPVRKFGFF